jgi:hypothetical protein
MGNSTSIARDRANEFDVVYEISMPFNNKDSNINLIDEDGEVQVIISDIPEPKGYYQNSDSSLEDEKLKNKAVARWIIEDSASALDEYDWTTSSHISNNRNHYLRDIYFTCEYDKVDDAVIDAKKFLSILEEKVVRHHRRVNKSLSDSPSKKLNLE